MHKHPKRKERIVMPTFLWNCNSFEDLKVLKEEGQWKDLKMINGNIYSITRSSSWSLEILAKRMKSLTYEPIRPFKFSIFHINESPHQTVQEKKNHVEVWNNSDVIAGRSLWSGSMRLNHIVKKNSQERDHYVNDIIRETSYKEYLTNRNISHCTFHRLHRLTPGSFNQQSKPPSSAPLFSGSHVPWSLSQT